MAELDMFLLLFYYNFFSPLFHFAVQAYLEQYFIAITVLLHWDIYYHWEHFKQHPTERLENHVYILTLKQIGCCSLNHSSFPPQPSRTWWKEGPARKNIVCNPCFVEGKTEVPADTLCNRRALLHYPAKNTRGRPHQIWFPLSHWTSSNFAWSCLPI